MPLTPAELIQAFHDCLPDLDAWSERLKDVTEPPGGSALALDDVAWPYHPLSTSVWTSMAGATDHLQAVRNSIEADIGHPFALFTLTRTALLGSSQAVWALAPDDPMLRRARGIHLAHEFTSNWLNWAKEVAPDALADRSGTGYIVATTQAKLRLQGLEYVRKEHPLITRVDRRSTSIVREAGKIVFPTRPDLARSVVAQWRSSSSDGHALGWGALTRGHDMQGQSGNLARFAVGGGLGPTVDHFKAGFLMLSWAWQRYDALASPP